MKTTKPKVNRKLLRKIRDMIAKRPRQFLMSCFYDDTDEAGNDAPHCGTAACIAGWAVVLSGKAKNPADARAKSQRWNFDSWAIGKRALKLDQDQATALFDLDSWPYQFFHRFKSATRAGSSRRCSLAAVARINHFLKTGE